jgi:hypothetical protein
LPRIPNRVFWGVGLHAGKGVRRVKTRDFYVVRVKGQEGSNNQPTKGDFWVEFRLAEEKGEESFEQQGVFLEFRYKIQNSRQVEEVSEKRGLVRVRVPRREGKGKKAQ